MTTRRALGHKSSVNTTPFLPARTGTVNHRFRRFARNLRFRRHSGSNRFANSNIRSYRCVQRTISIQTNAVGRVAQVKRTTKETNVDIQIALDGTGMCSAKTPIPFLNHMLDQLASHGLFDLTVVADGDVWIDDHHTNEDIALALGTALSDALGDRKGIHRFGHFLAPLDEALVQVALDLSGRPHLTFDMKIPTQRIGNYDTQLVEHFFRSLVNTSGMTLHVRQLSGENSHHIVEACFKAFARSLRSATEIDGRRAGTIASSKGVLTQQ